MARLLPLALICAAFAVPSKASAIVGGSPASLDRWPFMAAIDFVGADAYRGQLCGGTLISPTRVLTAAHCVEGDAPPQIQVLVGRERLTQPGGRAVPVRSIALFPGYVSDTEHLDAAILTLAEPAGVPPVRLATPADAAAWAPGTPAWVAGWGRLNANTTSSGGDYYGDRLRELQQPIASDDACESVYGGGTDDIPYRPQWTLCAGTAAGGAGPCYGDSGGPLAVQTPTGLMQIGIVLGGDGCAEPGYYDLYTRVDRISAFAHRAKLTLQPWATSPPRLRGRLRKGTRVTCETGTWADHPTGFNYSWFRIGETRPVPLLDAGRRHRVTAADAESGLICGVTGSNAGGSSGALSRPLLP